MWHWNFIALPRSCGIKTFFTMHVLSLILRVVTWKLLVGGLIDVDLESKLSKTVNCNAQNYMLTTLNQMSYLKLNHDLKFCAKRVNHFSISLSTSFLTGSMLKIYFQISLQVRLYICAYLHTNVKLCFVFMQHRIVWC